MKRENRLPGQPFFILRLFLCLAVFFFLPAQPAKAAKSPARTSVSIVDPIGHRDNYSAILYNNTNGLPTSEANDIVQTSEGFIWIGSYGGLIRYDGNTFERMDSTSGISSITCLFVDSRNRLWIGTNDSGLALMENGKYRIWGAKEGFTSSVITCIDEDRNGTIYVGTTHGIMMISPDYTVSTFDDPRVSKAYIDKIRRGYDDLLYCLTNQDDYFTIRKNSLLNYTDHTMSPIQGITCLLPDMNSPGKVYLGTETSTVYYGSPGEDPLQMKRIDISPLNCLMEMRQIGDKVWLCGLNGIGVLDDRGFHALDQLPLNNTVCQVMADYQGNLWFTSRRQGVMKLVSNPFTDLFGQFGMEENVVNSTCKYDGKLFIATDTGLMVTDDKGPVDSVPITSAKTASGQALGAKDLIKHLKGCRIRSLIRDSKDRLWISTWRARDLLRYDHGDLTVFTEADGLLSNHVRTVYEASDGSMLVACTGGVNVIEGDRITAAYDESNGITNPETLSVCSAPNGDIVMGSNGGGIYVINKDGTRCIDQKQGLSSGIVMRVKYDSQQKLFWIVTSNSIAYMSEDYQVTTVGNFPYSNNFDIYKNSREDLWILSSNGIYVLPCEQMLSGDEVRPVHYGLADGLPCVSTANSYSELTEEGDLYIAGNTGVALINIENSFENISNVKQAVPFVDADESRIYPDRKGNFRIPADTQKLTIYDYVYNYSLSDPRVSYRLEGFDRHTVTVNCKNLTPVSYTNLPGGSYRFKMELTDSLEQGKKTLYINITKAKKVYEYVWFYWVCGLGAALLVALFVHAYLKRQTQALEKKHREAAERERINSELNMATEIQKGMVPHDFPPFPDRDEFDVYAVMEPAREVGGDFYDFFLIDDDHLCLVMADVSGKGIPAALFMMVSKVLLQSYAVMSQSAAEILTKVNDFLSSDNKVDMFVTVWLGIMEISTGKVIAANAGHEYPIIKHAGRPFELLKDTHGLVIGAMDGIEYKDYKIQLSPGDKLFVYTDGVPEASNEDRAMFGTDRLIAVLNENPDASPEQIMKNVHAAVDRFVKDTEQFDDLTMLCIEYKGKEKKH